jgi:hypothetical protein
VFQARYLVSRSVEFDVKLMQATIPQSVYAVYSYLCVSLKRIAFSLVVKAVLKGSAMCILGTAQKHNDHLYSTSPANWTAEEADLRPRSQGSRSSPPDEPHLGKEQAPERYNPIFSKPVRPSAGQDHQRSRAGPSSSIQLRATYSCGINRLSSLTAACRAPAETLHQA